MKYLRDHNDPRLVDNGKFFETSPMTDGFKRPVKAIQKIQIEKMNLLKLSYSSFYSFIRHSITWG